MGLNDVGIINLDSDFAKKIGFTSDKFAGYLWKKGNRIIISTIFSIEEGKGNLKSLFAEIESFGFKVIVPTPLPLMESILRRWGFICRVKKDRKFGSVELWEKN